MYQANIHCQHTTLAHTKAQTPIMSKSQNPLTTRASPDQAEAHTNPELKTPSLPFTDSQPHHLFPMNNRSMS